MFIVTLTWTQKIMTIGKRICSEENIEVLVSSAERFLVRKMVIIKLNHLQKPVLVMLRCSCATCNIFPICSVTYMVMKLGAMSAFPCTCTGKMEYQIEERHLVICAVSDKTACELV